MSRPITATSAALPLACLLAAALSCAAAQAEVTVTEAKGGTYTDAVLAD